MSTTDRTKGPTARIAPWNRFEEAALDVNVRRRLFTEDRAMVVHCDFAPGTVVPTHLHSVEQTTTCLVGHVQVTFDDHTVALEPGSVLQIPAYALHSLRVLGDDKAETLTIFQPEVPRPEA
jgi:quercetin dioxygenase-like cupin family protein